MGKVKLKVGIHDMQETAMERTSTLTDYIFIFPFCHLVRYQISLLLEGFFSFFFRKLRGGSFNKNNKSSLLFCRIKKLVYFRHLKSS